ncbi:MAG: PEGA domain-containing protein [Alphaproteobacteria bacterium]|nr:PEGA domain-containing protein [Alphaproteobacteria bacterium]
MRRRLLPLLAALAPLDALGAQPVARVALVVDAEPAVPAGVVSRCEGDLIEILEGSGRYRFLAPSLVDERLRGEDPRRACGDDVACWQDHARRSGADVLVSMHLTAAGEDVRAHLRLATADIDPLRFAGLVPRGGGAPLTIVEHMFLDPGTLTVEGPPEAAELELDGEAVVALEPLPAGKHQLRITAPGHLPAVTTALVFPDRDTALQVTLTPVPVEAATARRWTRVAAVAMLAGGVGVALAVGVAPASAYSN